MVVWQVTTVVYLLPLQSHLRSEIKVKSRLYSVFYHQFLLAQFLAARSTISFSDKSCSSLGGIFFTTLTGVIAMDTVLPFTGGGFAVFLLASLAL